MDHQTPIQRALAVFENSPTKLARALGGDVKRQHVEHWLKSGSVPTEHCRPISDLTGVPCWDFRPDDWYRIWPDLRARLDAPAVPGFPDAPPVPAEPRPAAEVR